ncbi:hypothetical protein [Streptococcus cuniculi]|uniref:Uncharacterized protein n=1 Tax=Streptococcus cuniculi TaxID=1432788 RepID=A0A4Y9JCN3_9STRE|nr:hypothetical protein [Streptococcus cuniculi]MBF0778334.1 hypothetical protein [Streptococcus cuniculi]TFU97826.1 hypothetical protein E4T82_06280 [Streptococcus cuniculi]
MKTTDKIIHQYESLAIDITVPISALNIVLDWLFSRNIEPYTDLVALAINDLQRLSDKHSKYIQEELYNDK